MDYLLSGLVCLVSSIQKHIYLDLQISPNYVRVIWFEKSLEEIIDFESFYWTSEEEKVRAIESAIHYVTKCAVSDILNNERIAA